jgi:hypothetical protein
MIHVCVCLALLPVELQVLELLQYAGSGLSTDKYTGNSLDSTFKQHAVGAYRET